MKRTIPEIAGRKAATGSNRIVMVTAYDYPTALIADRAGVDIILVGDSLGMVVLGYDSTVPVTMEDMLHHTKAARRGTKEALLVGDMPFGSFQEGPEQAVRNAIRFMKEAGAEAVKLEGGVGQAEVARTLVRNGIPVMGHIGLLPQLVSATGGFKVQGRDARGAQKLIDDAKALEDAGCFSLVLEAIPDRLAGLITRSLSIPTIGIGAGAECDGQVLVMHDLIGLFDRFTPRFVKKYANTASIIEEALSQYRDDVISGQFPAKEHSFTIKDEVLDGLYGDK